MKNMKDKTQVSRAYQIVTEALLDPDTRLRKPLHFQRFIYVLIFP